jgi:uncharacterized damage-inducible protein DinB
MASNMIDRYRRWFEYEQEMHAQVVASLAAVPENLRAQAGYRKAVDLVAHMAMARHLWLYRMGGLPEGPRDLFPVDISLEEARSRLDDVQRAWVAHLGRLDDTALAREFQYQSLEGVWYRNMVEDILTQLFGHSWYHRGQIAALVRSLGCEPAATDFVFWTREPLPPEKIPSGA